MFDKEGIWLLGELERFVEETMLPVEEQEHIGNRKKAWTADYWTIEVAKCLRMGEDAYLETPLPPWLENNPYFQPYGKKHVIGCAKYKIRNLENLGKFKDRSNNLLVCQIGRGLPVIVAFQVKRWRRILAYDNIDYGRLLDGFFIPRLGVKIEFEIGDTANFSTEGLKTDVVMTGHNTRFTAEQLKEIALCDKVKGYTYDGHIIK